MDAELTSCASCGRPLLGDPEDDPIADGGQPLCGDCVRARTFDVLLWEMDYADGELDAEID